MGQGRRGWHLAVVAAAALCSCVHGGSAAEPASALDWRLSTRNGPVLRELVHHAVTTLAEAAPPRAELTSEGLLASDPQKVASLAAARPLKDVEAWALCAKVAPAARDRDACRSRAVAAVGAWVRVNRPRGNPIDDAQLLPLLEAVDLAVPALTPDDRAAALAWAHSVADRGDEFYKTLEGGTSDRLVNNWQTWRLSLRALSAVVAGDEPLLQDTAARLERHLAANIRDDGSTLDFHDRDALHYQLYDLQPLVRLALLAPRALTPPARARVAKALAFLEPYVAGKTTHVEFAHSQVAFDAKRREAGEEGFQTVAWDPAKAGPLLRQARAVFPAVRPWSGQAASAKLHPVDAAVCASLH